MRAREITCGHAGFVVDPVDRRVIALRLAKTSGSWDTVRWEDLTAFGPDAVTPPTRASVNGARGPVAELGGKDAELGGKRLSTDAGSELARSTTSTSTPRPARSPTLINADDRIAGDRLIGCRSYAVVVRAV